MFPVTQLYRFRHTHTHAGQLQYRLDVVLLILFIMSPAWLKRLSDPDCLYTAVVKVAMVMEKNYDSLEGVLYLNEHQ